MCTLCRDTGYIDLNEWAGPAEMDDPRKPCPRCNPETPTVGSEYPDDLVTLMEPRGVL